MSHYVAFVLVPQSVKDVKEYLDTVLAPYDENKQVEKYRGKDGKWTTYNPNSKWDWWEEGGRWNREGKNRMTVKDCLANLIPEPRPPEEDRAYWDSIWKSGLLSPYAIIDLDGAWHEKGKMGWWAMDSDVKEDWPDIAKAILTRVAEDRPNTIAVVVDLHI